MKRTVIALATGFAALFSTAALAFPTQGDYVKFDLTQTPEGATAPFTGTYEEELTSLDLTNNTYTQLNTLTVTGVSSSQDSSSGQASDLSSTDNVTAILQNCGGNGGALATLNTPAGTFQTCGLPISNNAEVGVLWVGLVPFGIVQADLTLINNNTHIQMTLNSFH